MNLLKGISLIGGDKRQHYIGSYFHNKGYQVYSFSNSAGFNICCSLDEIINKSNVIVLPMPVTGKPGFINTCSDIPLLCESLMEKLTPNHIIFGGCFPENMITFFNLNKIVYFDFIKDAKIAYLNSIATAEGAIMEAIKESSINIHDSRILITGFGKCAKALSSRLHALNGHITIAARNENDLSCARIYGYETINISEISSSAKRYDYIFNTVPALVINKEIICELKKECIIIDIASYPGGVDFNEARYHNIKALLKLSIPGRVSPASSGYILSDCIENNLKKLL